MRVCFAMGDEGHHRFSIRIVDDDGLDILTSPVSSEIDIELPEDTVFVTENLVLNFLQLRFEHPGQYSVDVVVDDEMMARIPLRVDGTEKLRGARA